MSFIRECVESLHDRYQEGISNLYILLPTQRAKSFFKLELASFIKDRPIWQPSFLSVNDLMSKVTELKAVDKIRLITELYGVYSKYHNESLDKFYYWGGVLLSDFSTLDNYKCDASVLFSNVSDIKEIEERFDYLSQEQKDVILQFWGVFKDSANYSASQKEFLRLWNTLYSIYTEYKALLESKGIGYPGMIYRKASELIECGADIEYLKGKKVVVVGFNALSATEMTLFDYLKESCQGEFYWDYDNYYKDNTSQEAGLFIRENIKRYSEQLLHLDRDNFIKEKKINIITTPSETLSCKYISHYLRELSSKATIGRETAIVLTNDSLLTPLLYSIPPEIEHFNVTSGYPLKLTNAFLLVEYLINLKLSAITKTGVCSYYHKDLFKVIAHPYVQYVLSTQDKSALLELQKESQEHYMAYIPLSRVSVSDITRELFTLPDEPVAFYTYIEQLFISMIERSGDSFDKENIEYINKTLETIISLRASLESSPVALSINVASTLLKKHLSTVSITFEGEPLLGMQVMGILESRNLDFENVVILSMSEDNYPSVGNLLSLIPSNLRFGYGLPTIANQEAMYSYYFYRLLQRAKNIDILYSSYAGESLSGEPSRYIHQLKIESPHSDKIVTKNINLKITSPRTEAITIAKDSRVAAELDNYLTGKRSLSASRLFEYIECPLRFYFNTIEKIRVEKEAEEEIDATAAGNILHKVLQDLYTSVKEHTLSLQDILDSTPCLLTQSVNEEISTLLDISISEFSGRLKSKSLEIVTYARNIINYDLESGVDFEIQALEGEVNTLYSFGDKKVRLYGKIDRIDSLPGDIIRILDYKSGKSKHDTSSLSDSMTTNSGKLSKQVFQPLFYSLAYKNQYGGELQPAIYAAKDISSPRYSPLLTIEKEPLYRYSAVEGEFKTLFDERLDALFNLDIPFYQCDSDKDCLYCDYKKICKREPELNY